MIVNKSHAIDPLDFRPDLVDVGGYEVARIAADPLTRMLDAAATAGVRLKVASAFRSYEHQQDVFARHVASKGKEGADAVSARAGHSEHQTGLAVDLQMLDGTCTLDPCFADTDGGRWLAKHAADFGFVIRYTKANQAVTRYSSEPWHFRYVGQPLADELRRSHVGSLEDFFGVEGGEYPSP